MSAVGEREPVATKFDHHLQTFERLKASMAATDMRIAQFREAIRGAAYRSVAEALEEKPARDDTIAPIDAPTAGAAALLPWVLVVAVVAVPIFYILLGSEKPPATNRPPDVRSISLASVTTAIAPRESERVLPNIAEMD